MSRNIDLKKKFLRDDMLTYKKKYLMVCKECTPYLDQLQIAIKVDKVKV